MALLVSKNAFKQSVMEYKLNNEYNIMDICGNLCYKYNNDFVNMLQRSQIMNVNKILILGLDITQWNEALKLTKQYPKMLYFGIGIHPHDAKTPYGFKNKNNNNNINIYNVLESFYNKCKKNNYNLVCIGECGLDYNRMFSPRHIQMNVFRHHVKLAFKYKLPLVCHERAAFNDFIKIIQQEIKLYWDKQCSPVDIVIHCFTGNENELKTYIKMGFYIGVTTYLCNIERSKLLRNAIKNGFLPLNRLLIETDAPFMKPKFDKIDGNDRYVKLTPYLTKTKRKKGNNEPCLLPCLLNSLYICYNKKYTIKEIALETWNNSMKVLNINNNNQNKSEMKSNDEPDWKALYLDLKKKYDLISQQKRQLTQKLKDYQQNSTNKPS